MNKKQLYIEPQQEVKKRKDTIEFFLSILESLPHSFCVIDANDYTIKIANSEACPRDMELSAGGIKCHSLTHGKDIPCDSADHICPINEIKRTGEPVVVEHIHYDKDHNPIYVEVHGYPVFDSSGNISEIIEYAINITDRKNAKLQLKHAAEEWRATFDSISDFVSIHDKNCNIIRVNKSFAEALKMKPDEVIGKKCYQLVHGTKEPCASCPHVKVLESRLPQTSVFFEPHLGIPLEVTACPVFNEDGQVWATVHIAKDISERKEVEKQIADIAKFPSENPNPVLRVTGDGIVLYANRAAENLFGIHDGDSERNVPENWIEIVRNSYSTGSTEHVEFECNQQILSFTFMPVSDSGYVNIYGLDITRRKQFEREQARLLQKLEHVNRELNDFAHIVSHDLKAPLRGIKTLADWLVSDYQDKLDTEGREHLIMITHRVERMSNMIDGILGYSRVGRSEAQKVTVDLKELVPEVIEMVAPPESITVSIIGELPVIDFEDTKIIQVFQNLLSNAVKYMDKPQGQVSIDCLEEDNFWKFSVGDNGPGIREKDFERIFQIFQTLSDGERADSTGVGLSVVKKIIESNGGKIWVQSKLGEGSTFFFTLPKQEIAVTV